MHIGILALQGAFIEHARKLQQMNIDAFEIRQLSHLDRDYDGIILPGGESTTMGKLLSELHMLIPLRERILSGLPVFGTCAGLILLSKHITNAEQPGIGTMDITCERNSYGRQLGSFSAIASFAGKEIPMVFIRAPHIKEAGKDVRILATVNGRIVAARQDNMLATSFHPELTEDFTVYDYFMKMIRESA